MLDSLEQKFEYTRLVTVKGLNNINLLVTLISGRIIEKVSQFNYLGSDIDYDRNYDIDVK